MDRTELLSFALDGARHTLAIVQERIAEIEAELRGTAKAKPISKPKPAYMIRHMTKAGREAIAAAQRKRWAAYNAKKKKVA